MTSNDHSLDNPDLTPWDENCASRYRDLGFWRGVPLDDIVSRGAVLFKDNIAIFSSKRSWTYGVLNQKVNELAAGFIKLGIRADEKVVVQLPNIGEFLEVVFALFRIGAVPVYTLPAHRYMEIESFCRLTDASAYIVADRVARFDYRELARKLLPSTSLKHVIIVGDAQEFTALDQLYQQPIACSPRKSSSIALLQLSGGTTNVPKLIPRTHDDYYYSVRESAKICCLNEASIYMAALPVAHNFPHSSPGVLGTLYAGGSVVMAESPAPDLAFDLIEKYAVTITALVPSLAMVWMAAGKNAHQELSSLQVIQVGGAKFGSESAKKLVSVFNCKLQQVFGMAEGLVNYTRLDDPDEITFYTQGRPISEADEIRIVDTEDNDLANGQVGELLTRGPYTIRGYFRAAEYNKRTFTNDGFYRTGDIVRKTDQGYLVVEGRIKDQINRGGEKISAAEVENQLMVHESIHDVAIVAMPDPYLGEKSCAFIIISDHVTSQPKAAELRAFLCHRGLADYKLPDRFEFYQELPKTSFGKVNKQALRDILADRLTDATAVQRIERA